MKRQELVFLLILILIGVLFRFYNLFWGAPFYFHPDERNIAGSISQLNFPSQLNPHFFAYGSLPIYFTFIFGLITNILTNTGTFSTLPFDSAIHSLRIISATFSVLLIPLLYWCGKLLKDTRTGFLAAIMGMGSIGFIQFAHFGTFEMWLTLFSLLSFTFTLYYLNKPSFSLFLILSVFFGLLLGTKISSLFLLPLFLIPLLFTKKNALLSFKISTLHLLSFITVSSIIYLLSNPYSILDYPSFKDSITYESHVATGSLLVFYTGEFFKSNPFTFHLIHIYPFLLNPLILTLLIPSLVFLFIFTLKKRSILYLFLLLWLIGTFIPQTLLFVKWTRYVIPTLPFIYLVVSLALVHLYDHLVKKPILSRKIFLTSSIMIFMIINCFFAFSYVYTAFITQDTRIEAANFAKKIFNPQTKVLSEVYDLGITPFNEFAPITLFNMYDLDPGNEISNTKTLHEQLSQSHYLVLPSHRLLKTRILDPKNFPHGHRFYYDLLHGKTQFSKLYETPCDLFCQVTYWSDPVFSFEQTINIFDRPNVYIFKNDNFTSN